MANEAIQLTINQAGDGWIDNTPDQVSTGYQAQNTNAEAVYNGLDLTAPFASSSTEITIPIGGVFDSDGVLFVVTTATVLSVPSEDTDYYILASGTGTQLTLSLTTSSGTFDAEKNARYLSSERLLDWVVRRDATTVNFRKFLNKNIKDFLINRILKELFIDDGNRTGARIFSTGDTFAIRAVINGVEKGTADFFYDESLGGWRFEDNLFIGSGGIETEGNIIQQRSSPAIRMTDTADSRPCTMSLNSSVFEIHMAGAAANAGTIRFDTGSGAGAERARIESTGLDLSIPFLPTSTPTSGSQTITAGSTFVFPRGIWFISATQGISSGNVIIEAQISSLWRAVFVRSAAVANDTGMCFFSNGTDVRFNNGISGDYTIFYQRY